MAERLGTALLAVPRNGEVVWAWLGSRREMSSHSIREVLEGKRGPNVKFAVGEPRRDLAGWRLTHFEARATLGVAIHG